MPTPKKVAKVTELKKLLGKSSLIVITDYRGTNVADMSNLRRQLRSKNVTFQVTKNTLAMLASKEVGLIPLQTGLSGPTAIAFAEANDIAEAAKALTDIAKGSKTFAIRSGILDGKTISSAEITDLANLPSRPELVARLLGQLNAPITGLVTVLNGPIRSLAYVLQARVTQLEEQAS